MGRFKYQIGHLEAATRVVYLSPGVPDSSSHYLVGISSRLFPKSLKKLKSKYCNISCILGTRATSYPLMMKQM